MRTGVVLVLAAAVFALAGAVALAADKDTGRWRPPPALTEDHKAIWMGEWVACRHLKLAKLAHTIGVKIPPGRPPQVAARLIAKKAEAPLWILADELQAAVDGCRNGILWRYYHEPNLK
jgi:hypothetical protein